MSKQTVQLSPEAEYRLRVISWLAMFSAIAMYYVIVRMVPPKSPTANPTLVNALLVLAIGLTAASFGVKSYIFKRAQESQNRGLIRTGELVALNFCGAAALLGLLVWFLTSAPNYYWFLILGAAGELLHFPRAVE